MDSMNMASTPLATLVKMMNTLPEPVQEQVVDHLREYMEDLQDEFVGTACSKNTVAVGRSSKAR